VTARLTRRAISQAEALLRHYRAEAIENLAAAIRAAQILIPTLRQHRAAPAPYPEVARPGTGWIRQGRYWFAYGTRRPGVIRAIYYDAADVPGRPSHHDGKMPAAAG
jgi:hypothetical protein